MFPLIFPNLFGRSHETRILDDALRSSGLHPRLIPDAVKITTLKILKEDGKGEKPCIKSCTFAANMLAYCMLGDQGFYEEHGEAHRARLEKRLQVAIGIEDSLDNRLILLTLHASLTQEALIVRYNLHVDNVPK